jgi:translation initiation factor 1
VKPRGRAGKGVTVITGVPWLETELEKLAKTLKQRCGTGGTVKNGTIEIQRRPSGSDHCRIDRVWLGG